MAAIEKAKRWLTSARLDVENGLYDNAVYHAQMSVETSAKAVLLALGIDFPKEHDVSWPFVELRERMDLPSWFRGEVTEMARSIKILAEIRGVVAYPHEKGLEVGTFKAEAEKALAKAETCTSACERLLKEILKR